ncbi:unnamed protein product [Amoebophrya sp. A120]|nr:unnamed protein product [Amoebophrya sp. A120]|eukprot:GSA120T00008396001.1
MIRGAPLLWPVWLCDLLAGRAKVFACWAGWVVAPPLVALFRPGPARFSCDLCAWRRRAPVEGRADGTWVCAGFFCASLPRSTCRCGSGPRPQMVLSLLRMDFGSRLRSLGPYSLW